MMKSIYLLMGYKGLRRYFATDNNNIRDKWVKINWPADKCLTPRLLLSSFAYRLEIRCTRDKLMKKEGDGIDCWTNVVLCSHKYVYILLSFYCCFTFIETVSEDFGIFRYQENHVSDEDRLDSLIGTVHLPNTKLFFWKKLTCSMWLYRKQEHLSFNRPEWSKANNKTIGTWFWWAVFVPPKERWTSIDFWRVTKFNINAANMMDTKLVMNWFNTYSLNQF